MYTNILFILATICCTVSANILLKLGASREPLSLLWPLSLINGMVILGGCIFGAGLIFYTSLLQRMPLNIVQSIFSIQFIAVILASAVFLGESISPVRWVGIAFVAIGLGIIGYSAAN